jgi:hypothetical protein
MYGHASDYHLHFLHFAVYSIYVRLPNIITPSRLFVAISEPLSLLSSPHHDYHYYVDPDYCLQFHCPPSFSLSFFTPPSPFHKKERIINVNYHKQQLQAISI